VSPARVISYTIYITSYRHVTLQPSPSSKTSYAVLGDNASPSELTAIEKHAARRQDVEKDRAFALSSLAKCPPFHWTRPSTSPNAMVVESRSCNILYYKHNFLQTRHDQTVTVLQDVLGDTRRQDTETDGNIPLSSPANIPPFHVRRPTTHRQMLCWVNPACTISYTMYITCYRGVAIRPSLSSKKSYVVLGDNTHPSKVAAIKKHAARRQDVEEDRDFPLCLHRRTVLLVTRRCHRPRQLLWWVSPARVISYTIYITSYRHVTLQPSPSSKTSYVVLGDNAGPSKLAAIRKHAARPRDVEGDGHIYSYCTLLPECVGGPWTSKQIRQPEYHGHRTMAEGHSPAHYIHNFLL
jgi:hypothetical protein